GTSMAAPYVSGAIALIKEAHPDWKAEKIYHALKTTAVPLQDEENELIAPHIQGHGHTQVGKAIDTPTIIYSKALQLGKINENNANKKQTIKIENLSGQKQKFAFQTPKSKNGLGWKLPFSFTVLPN